MLKYIELLEKTEKGIKAEFLKVKSGGSRNDWGRERQLIINQERIVGFYDYVGEQTKLTFEPDQVDVNRIWHPGRQDQTTWDCVPHAMNMLLGCAYIKERSQHLCLSALARHNSKESEQQNKMTAGVYLSYFNKGITDG